MADDEDRALKDQRIHVLMTEAEVAAIDDWAFAHRIKSRGEAMRRLCAIALNLEKNTQSIASAGLGTAKATRALLTAVHQHGDAVPLDVAERILDLYENMGTFVGEVGTIATTMPFSNNPDFASAQAEFSERLERTEREREDIAEFNEELSEHRPPKKKT